MPRFKAFVFLLILTLSTTTWAQYQCGSNLETIRSDSSFLGGPRALDMNEVKESKELLIKSQQKLLSSLQLSRTVMVELKECFAEMGEQWLAQPGSHCQAFKNYTTLDYSALIYKKIPSLYKALRINLALAVKPPRHDHVTDKPLWNWINKDMVKGFRWPDIVTQHEPLLSSNNPKIKGEQELAEEMFFTELRTIVIDYAKLIADSNDETEQILFQILLDAISFDNPNDILLAVHKNLWREKNVEPVGRWFQYIHRRLVEFRKKRLKNAMIILNMFRPMANLGTAQPLPHQLRDILEGTLTYNKEAISRVQSDIREFTHMVDYIKIEDNIRDFLTHKEFIQSVVDENKSYCNIANLLHFRNEIHQRNNTIGTVVIGLAIGIYARIIVSTAAFLGFSINEVYKAETEAHQAEIFFKAQPIPVNSVVSLDQLMETRDNLRMSYYMVPLAFIGAPISKVTVAPVTLVSRGIGKLVKLGNSRGKKVFEHISPNGQRTLFIEKGPK